MAVIIRFIYAVVISNFEFMKCFTRHVEFYDIITDRNEGQELKV